MARGWESKSVEAQQAETDAGAFPPRPSLSPDEANLLHRLDGLQLSRRHVLSQMETARNAHHRIMLQRALAELDRQIEALKSS